MGTIKAKGLFLGWQMPSLGVWEVGKTRLSCKEAGSVQYKAQCRLHASNSDINWDAKISNKLKNDKK